MTFSVEHSLKFVTEFDETHPIGQQVMALPNEMRLKLLEGMLKDLLAPMIQPAIDSINENGSYAILKVAE
jgi:hypothetical protein